MRTDASALTFSRIGADDALRRALEVGRVGVLDAVRESGLRGRGGAGFPTGSKWNLCASAAGERKLIVCNADEGEPGTFKDRVILQEFPDLLLSAMTIAAFAVGAREGIVYLRAEYTYLLDHLLGAIARRAEAGLLGARILGHDGLDFEVRVQLGAGAYVCGEETALIESLEGHRGEPRNRPPYPVDTGYLGCPTVVNNVETLCWAAAVVLRGPAWFRTLGTAKSPGLKLLSVSGDCDLPGVYEVPLGVTIAELLERVGGASAKAVQVGGASGTCVPRSLFHQVIAYEGKSTGGSVIVLGPHRDMLHLAENFLEFFVDESCGQCTPCREGNRQLLAGVRLLAEGRCSTRYLNELRSLGETMKLASKCGLGQSSPNAFLSIVEHFPDEILGRRQSPARPAATPEPRRHPR